MKPLTEFLPDTLPDDPLPLAASWLQQAYAAASQPNPNAMVLARFGSVRLAVHTESGARNRTITPSITTESPGCTRNQGTPIVWAVINDS